MAVQKPSIPKGTRDFLPSEMVRRNYIFDSIRSIFSLYGYLPIETPAMENLSSLLGKYGEEGDKLLFRILNSGDFLESYRNEAQTQSSKEFSTKISEKGLRYDLTVPLARFVVQHQQELIFPFRRYQIQPVWRADRPQKGRYREFFQCDVDAIGSDSLQLEGELINIIHDVFGKLKISVIIKINNRKILAGIAGKVGNPEMLTDLTVALDKFEKVGVEKVSEELLQKGFTSEAVDKIRPLMKPFESNDEKFHFIEDFLCDSEEGLKGLQELRQVFKLAPQDVEFDLSLARGLNYYTGTIIEVKAKDVQMGSICGGGRYDNLTGIFGLPGLSGVGISFGADRIYDVMNELNLFPSKIQSVTKVLFVNFGEEEAAYCNPILKKIRSEEISAEIYPDAGKMKKQMEYANKKQIPYVVLVGENEMKNNRLNVKNMNSGEQKEMTLQEFIGLLKADRE
jgi:histidyl-tRNA synthetase